MIMALNQILLLTYFTYVHPPTACKRATRSQRLLAPQIGYHSNVPWAIGRNWNILL